MDRLLELHVGKCEILKRFVMKNLKSFQGSLWVVCM